MIDDGVLAARLGVQRQLRLPTAEQPGRVPRTGEHHGVDVVVGDEVLAGVVVVAGQELHDVVGHAAAAAVLDDELARSAASRGAGLRITVLPAASAASTPPAGMAYGKFHGDATTVTRYGSNVRTRGTGAPRSGGSTSA